METAGLLGHPAGQANLLITLSLPAEQDMPHHGRGTIPMGT